jgi:hypothetical protein
MTVILSFFGDEEYSNSVNCRLDSGTEALHVGLGKPSGKYLVLVDAQHRW